jgi:hypothetical protein
MQTEEKVVQAIFFSEVGKEIIKISRYTNRNVVAIPLCVRMRRMKELLLAVTSTTSLVFALLLFFQERLPSSLLHPLQLGPYTEAKFLDEIQTKVSRVFLLAISESPSTALH